LKKNLQKNWFNFLGEVLLSTLAFQSEGFGVVWKRGGIGA
jgi:hypothetical protein